MSIQSEIDRIENNIAATYAELEEQGATMPSARNSTNLAATAATTKTVKYIAQTLTAAEKEQARENINAAGRFYGVCSTAADTVAKTVTVDDSFALVEGAQITVKFTNANSASSAPTLNVNGTGAKPLYRYGTTALSTGTTTTGWYAGSVQLFTYDGTGWIRDYWNNSTYSNVSLGQGYATCSTAAATVAKTAALSSYALTTGGIVAVKFTNDVPAGATLNINSKGARPIYYKGAAITAGVIKAGDTATFIYSTNYHLISVDKAGYVDNTITFDTFPTVEEVNAMAEWTVFKTRGFYFNGDGLACAYVVRNTAGSLRIPYGNKYIYPYDISTGLQKDIFVDLYGVRRGSADYAARNSEIMDALTAQLNNGFTLLFGSGDYYFSNPITTTVHTAFKGTVSNACTIVADVNYGTYLHFPNLADGQAAIGLPGGVIEDMGIVGNPNVCDVSIDRGTETNPSPTITEVNTGTTYGIKFNAAWTIIVQNVKVKNCTYGIHTPVGNGLISGVIAQRCKTGISVGNDVKINNVQVWNVMVGAELRGALAAVSNMRGDSIGKHLIECKDGRCFLTNIDGDYCVGSLVHYGGVSPSIHLGSITAGAGRVATKYCYSKNGSFDLQNVPASDYEYCSYISIAPNTSVFGGDIDIRNIASNPFDTPTEWLHPNSVISIAEGSTVKGLTIKCDIPYNADVNYFNKCVIKNLSTFAESNNSSSYLNPDFDGNTVEDICFITSSGFVRSVRTASELDRQLKGVEIPTALPNPNALTFTGAVTASYDGTAAKTVNIPAIPTSLKNPNALTFSGAVTGSYDGSSAKTVNIPTVPSALKNPNALTFTGSASGSYDGSAAKTVNIPADVSGAVDTLSAKVSQIEDVIEPMEVLVPSINLNEGVYEQGFFNEDGTDTTDSYHKGVAFRNSNYIPVQGGKSIAVYYDAAEWNKNNQGWPFNIVQYDANKNIIVAKQEHYPYITSGRPTVTLNANTAYVRLAIAKWASITTPLTDIKIAVYYSENAVLEYVSYGYGAEMSYGVSGSKVSLVSPNGTTYVLSVSDDGVLSAVLPIQE